MLTVRNSLLSIFPKSSFWKQASASISAGDISSRTEVESAPANSQTLFANVGAGESCVSLLPQSYPLDWFGFLSIKSLFPSSETERWEIQNRQKEELLHPEDLENSLPQEVNGGHQLGWCLEQSMATASHDGCAVPSVSEGVPLWMPVPGEQQVGRAPLHSCPACGLPIGI